MQLVGGPSAPAPGYEKDGGRQRAADLQAPAEREEPAAERRQLTVMFCDLVGSTDLSERLDPEELREVVRAYQSVGAAVISQFEGHIAQYLGDGLLVYFGYPLAHEDDAHRGVRTALGIIEEIERLNETLQPEKGITLAVRVGIHTGLVVVGEMGGGEKRERLALGDTPNIAARLQGLADPNKVVISSATSRLVEGFFDCYPMGKHSLKGVSRPMEIYSVRGERDVYSRFEVAITTGLTPFIGRKEEVQKLLDCWARAKAGEQQVGLINGEAGIGKSRLLQVFKEHISEEPHSWMICRCSAYYQNSAFYPVVELIQRLLGIDAEDPPSEKLGKLEKALDGFGFPLDDSVPILADLLSIPLTDDYAPLGLTPQVMKQRLLETLLNWLLKVSQQQPLVFVIENLHWVDPSTLEHLALLMDRGTKARLFILLTFRPQIEPLITTRSQLVEIILSRLDHRQVETMAGNVAGGKDLPAAVLDQVANKTDGVPLFVEELTKMILESEILVEEQDRYNLAGPLSQLAIPATLQDSLMARLDRLGSVKEIVQLGATLGREFSYDLIKSVSPHEEETLKTELGNLVKAELLDQHGTPPQSRYSFKQALIQDAAYHSLLKGTRQQYHRKIAQVLEQHFPETARANPEILGHHFTVAGLKEQAISYWHQAGRTATQRSANIEAINHLNNGLQLIKSLPDDTDRVEKELQFQVALGVPMTATKGFAAAEVEEIYARARALCQHLGKTPQLFPVLRGLWLFYLVRAGLRTALDLGMQLKGLAEDVNEPELVLQSHVILGVTLFYLGEFRESQRHLEQVLETYDREKHHSHAYTYGEDPAVVSLSYLSFIAWMIGYPDQALKRDQEALDFAKEVAHPFSLAFAFNISARLHQCRQDIRLALERAEATVNLSSKHGFTHWLTTGKILQGWAMSKAGQGEGGLALMREGLSMWQATGAEVSGPHCLTLLAEVYGETGQHENALEVVEEALASAQKNDERLYEPEIHRLKGDLLLNPPASAPAEAEACHRKALAVARDQGVKSLELRAAISLGRFLMAQTKKKGSPRDLGEHSWMVQGRT